ncbi:Hypothetical_protein [Hexamita inflata]|uniref:Hypothetical_protein n=1 Tax=Hexamita inflata TaxID=28002 RepID=A0AA86UWY8_9EUKA|nr:Hypothetical protein HINF_LOCUS55486 [Hexamita inflata]
MLQQLQNQYPKVRSKSVSLQDYQTQQSIVAIQKLKSLHNQQDAKLTRSSFIASRSTTRQPYTPQQAHLTKSISSLPIIDSPITVPRQKRFSKLKSPLQQREFRPTSKIDVFKLEKEQLVYNKMTDKIADLRMTQFGFKTSKIQ